MPASLILAKESEWEGVLRGWSWKREGKSKEIARTIYHAYLLLIFLNIMFIFFLLILSNKNFWIFFSLWRVANIYSHFCCFGSRGRIFSAFLRINSFLFFRILSLVVKLYSEIIWNYIILIFLFIGKHFLIIFLFKSWHI